MPTRKILNTPLGFVDDMLTGILAAHSTSLVAVTADRRALVDAAAPRRGVVGIVTGGGSGHLPLFLGYVGDGLASGVAIGNVFSSPSPAQILAATQAVDGGAGVLHLYGNYGGDIYNFDLARQVAQARGIDIATVRGTDDLLSAPSDRIRDRRGVAGLLFAFKVAGASAARGDDLPTVAAFAQRCVDRTRTVGIGVAPTILPAAGTPTFEVDEGFMEIGVGIHGEAGIGTVPLETAAMIANRFVQSIRTELALKRGTRLASLVNGLGSTPLEELYVLFGEVARLIETDGAQLTYTFVGNYATSLEMGGASLSLLELDDELEELLLAPASSPMFKSGSPVVPVPEFTGDNELARTIDVPTSPFESQLRSVILFTAALWAGHSDELRQLDAALGDGDLGVTVALGTEGVAKAVERLPTNVSASALLFEAGTAFATANPSSFAALVGGGLMAAAAACPDDRQLGPRDALAIGRAVAAHIAEVGGAKLGDKTLLDVLVPSLDQFEENVSDLPAVERAAWSQVELTKGLQSRRGRAAWHGRRSVGRSDPGAVAIAHLVSILAQLVHQSGPRTATVARSNQEGS